MTEAHHIIVELWDALKSKVLQKHVIENAQINKFSNEEIIKIYMNDGFQKELEEELYIMHNPKIVSIGADYITIEGFYRKYKNHKCNGFFVLMTYSIKLERKEI